MLAGEDRAVTWEVRGALTSELRPLRGNEHGCLQLKSSKNEPVMARVRGGFPLQLRAKGRAGRFLFSALLRGEVHFSFFPALWMLASEGHGTAHSFFEGVSSYLSLWKPGLSLLSALRLLSARGL